MARETGARRMIARYNRRITVQKNSVVTDRYGNHKNDWEDMFECYAYVSTWQREETEDSATTNEQRSVTFGVRYCSELSGLTSDKHRIVFQGENYNIESVDMMNYQQKIIQIKAGRTVRKG